MFPATNGRILPETVFAFAFARLTAFRAKHGFRKCREEGIGAVREQLSRTLPSNVAILCPVARCFVAGQRQAAAILEAECARCKGCKLGRK